MPHEHLANALRVRRRLLDLRHATLDERPQRFVHAGILIRRRHVKQSGVKGDFCGRLVEVYLVVKNARVLLVIRRGIKRKAHSYRARVGTKEANVTIES